MSTDIFISYASEDRSKVVELVRLLETDGWSVWWDRELKPGQDFESEIDQALTAARAVVVLWSQHSVTSSWVRSEAKEAKENNKLIPVLLDNARIPLTYRSLNTVDLTAWPDSPALMEISSFKSAVSRVLLEGSSRQPLKKPLPGDDMSLSVRVAQRVVEMVGPESNGSHEVASVAAQLDRCIADIILDLLAHYYSPQRLEDYLLHLGGVLEARATVRASVQFASGAVSEIRPLEGGQVAVDHEQSVLTYINRFCSPLGEANLDVPERRWEERTLLCLPLPGTKEEREFVFFLPADQSNWTHDMHNRLIKLAIGIERLRARDERLTSGAPT